MGKLSHHPVLNMQHRYNLTRLIETGTGIGEGIDFGLEFFDRIDSVEITESLAANMVKKYEGNDKVTIHCDHSVDFLEKVLKDAPIDEPILFWLDAHFPGADYVTKEYLALWDDEKNSPIRRELETIARMRKGAKDVILIDDLRIIKKLNNGAGLSCLKGTWNWIGTDFIHELFGATHDFKERYDYEASLTLTPK